jgi:hypothetical protein
MRTHSCNRGAVVTAETFFTDIPMSDQYSTTCEWRLTPTATGSHCRIAVQVAFKRTIWGVSRTLLEEIWLCLFLSAKSHA